MTYKRIRPPAVAGSFYPAGADSLRAELERCFQHAAGPGRLPTVRKAPLERTVGLMAPHAGYQYSGPTAALAYAALAERGTPTVAVILGPNHRGVGAALALSGAARWQTPLGQVPVRRDLADALARLVPEMRPDDAAHAPEHSLEVQLPFLQHLYGDAVPVLPVALAEQGLEAMVRLGQALARALRGERAAIIASSDLSHYLPDAETRRRDRLALDAVLTTDPARLARVVEEEDISMCGPGAVMAMLVACKELGALRATELGHATSADATGDTSWAVGYGAVLVE